MLPRDLLLDWNLLWHGLQNALSNARKYGDGGRVWVELRYADERLALEVCNDVDRGAQTGLIASHGEDATRLLHGRVEGGAALSTNLGSRALLACARLLGGEVSLRLAPEQTRLRLEVAAPRLVRRAAGGRVAS